MSKDKRHIDPTSFEEYKKYLDGKHSSSEQHAFEKKMLDDDFEAEALQGFENQDIHLLSDDLAELRQKIGQQKGRAGLNYFKMAAVIAFFLSFTVALFFIIKPNKEENVSDTKPTEILQKKSASENAPEVADTIEESTSDLLSDSDIPEKLSEPPVKPQPTPEEPLALLQEEGIIMIDEELAEKVIEYQNENATIKRVKSKEYQPIEEIILEPIPETGNLERVQTSTLEPAEDIKDSDKIKLPSVLKYDEGINEMPKAEKYQAEENITSRSKRAAQPSAGMAEVEMEAVVMEARLTPKPETGFVNFYKYINENLEGKKWPSVVLVKIKLNESGKVSEAVVTSYISESKKTLITKLISVGPLWIFEGGEEVTHTAFYEIEIPIDSNFR